MNILFVCRYNRFRSRVAEALFNYYNKNKKIQVKSAATTDAELDMPIISIARRALDTKGIPYKLDQKSKFADIKLINWADKIYVVADDAPIENLPREKTVKIDIPDNWHSKEETLETVREIEKFVQKIVKELA